MKKFACFATVAILLTSCFEQSAKALEEQNLPGLPTAPPAHSATKQQVPAVAKPAESPAATVPVPATTPPAKASGNEDKNAKPQEISEKIDTEGSPYISVIGSTGITMLYTTDGKSETFKRPVVVQVLGEYAKANDKLFRFDAKKLEPVSKFISRLEEAWDKHRDMEKRLNETYENYNIACNEIKKLEKDNEEANQRNQQVVDYHNLHRGLPKKADSIKKDLKSLKKAAENAKNDFDELKAKYEMVKASIKEVPNLSEKENDGKQDNVPPPPPKNKEPRGGQRK